MSNLNDSNGGTSEPIPFANSNSLSRSEGIYDVTINDNSISGSGAVLQTHKDNSTKYPTAKIPVYGSYRKETLEIDIPNKQLRFLGYSSDSKLKNVTVKVHLFGGY